jgi:hypothetical protein
MIDGVKSDIAMKASNSRSSSIPTEDMRALVALRQPIIVSESPSRCKDLISCEKNIKNKYKDRIKYRRNQSTMNVLNSCDTYYRNEDLFGEKFLKVTYRTFENNTRMDIKNVDLKS